MLRAYKYQIFPNNEQKVLIEKHFGCTRYIYNWALRRKIEAYQKDKKSIGRFELQSEMVNTLKKVQETEWLTEVSSQSLQYSLANLDMAYTKFFREKKGFPKFKSKHGRKSYQYQQGVRIDFESGKVFLPKLKMVDICISRTFEGNTKTTTVSKSATGKYYVSILVDNEKSLPQLKKIKEKKSLGIDLGLKHFAILSTGEKIENPKFLKKHLSKLAMHQRRLARKKKDSKNRNKQKLKVAKIHERITNLRQNYLHQLTARLIKENQFDTFCLESLNIKGMMQNRSLAKSISDVSWYEFIRQLKYKSEWGGKNVIQIGRFEPSSKLCTCGTLNNDLKLSDREWTCKNCGITHDRDILAANNIKRMALHPKNKIGEGTPQINAYGDVLLEASVK